MKKISFLVIEEIVNNKDFEKSDIEIETYDSTEKNIYKNVTMENYIF